MKLSRLIRTGILLALAGACAGCPVTQPQDVPGLTTRHRAAGADSDYYVYAPSDHAELGPMPLLVTLHGTHGFDRAKSQIKEWKALAEQYGFVVIAPSVSSPQGILPISRGSRRKDLARDEQRVLAAMQDIRDSGKYKINDKAVMITGFSAGGFPLYYIALRNPDEFSVIVGRFCNCDMKIVESIEITDKLRATPILIYFSKTGINPVSSNLNPVVRQSWAVYRHLRMNRCYEAKIKAVGGGHRRRPELAMDFWLKHQSKEFPRPNGE